MNLRDVSVRTKLLGLIGLETVGMAIVVAVALVSMRTTMLEERRLTMQGVVDAAHGVLAYHERLARSGVLSPDEARARAIAAVKGLRYKGQEYFWINDMGRAWSCIRRIRSSTART